MSFLGQVSFRGAWWGLVDQWKTNPYRWRVLAVSIVLTAAVLYGFIPDSQRVPPKPFDVVYISTFEEGRTDQQIEESNAANQELQDEYQAIRDERAQITKDFAEAVGRATGVDVDRMKAEAAREEAAAKREEDLRRAEIMRRYEEAKGTRNGAVAD